MSRTNHSVRSIVCVMIGAAVVLISTGGVIGQPTQFNDVQGFDSGTPGTPFAVPAGSIPYWSVDGSCSPAMSYQDGTRGDNGSKCIVTMTPVGTGTRLIRDLNPGPGSSAIGEMRVTELDVIRTLWASADDGTGTNGQELYRLLSPLYPVMAVQSDINPGAGGSNPQGLFQHAPGTLGNVYFSADNGTSGRELWRSSLSTGLSVTVAQLADINPGAGSSNPSQFRPGPAPGAGVPGKVFFAADDGTNGRELWVTDGTTTSLVKDINAVAGVSSDPQLLTSVIFVGNSDIKVFFSADDGVNGRELWRSDPIAGAVLVKDIVAGAAGSNPTNLTAGSPLVAGIATPTLFFTVDSDGLNGQELWKSRGAIDGSDTVQIYDPGAAGSPVNLTVLQSAGPPAVFILFFVVGNDLYKSDGTTLGTATLVKSFASPPANLKAASTGMFFAADDGTGGGVELWKADSTGATLVKDINAGAAGSSPQEILAIGGTVYFSADDGVNGRELWRTDTTAGAVLIKDINPGAAGSSPLNLTNFDGTIVFTADDGTHGREPWQSDGSDAPNKSGMSYKWDLASLITNKNAAEGAVAGSNAAPLYTYWLHDMPAMGGPGGVSEAAHQVNVYVELTDGVDRAPLEVTPVDCGDGNLPRPRAALTDGSFHNAVAFGMVAILDQDPCTASANGGGSPTQPVAPVPAIYDGHDWIPMDMAHISPGVPTAPPSGSVLGQTATFQYLATGMPSNLVAATEDPWSTKRFTYARLDVWSDYITVIWGGKQHGKVWVATVPRQYKRGFEALYFGNKGCVQSAYPAYLDSVQLHGGTFVSTAEAVGACCLSSGTCVDGVISDTACVAMGGSWAGFDTTCGAAACMGACCQAMAVCTDVEAGACVNELNGEFRGVGTTCATATCPCHTPTADADWDGDVDQADFAAFQDCFTGVGPATLAPECKCFDRHPVAYPAAGYDGDVDVDDFEAFEKCATGSGIALDPGC